MISTNKQFGRQKDHKISKNQKERENSIDCTQINKNRLQKINKEEFLNLKFNNTQYKIKINPKNLILKIINNIMTTVYHQKHSNILKIKENKNKSFVKVKKLNKK